MKKALSAVLAVVLVLGVCFSVPMIASAETETTLSYELNEAGTGFIVSANNTNIEGEDGVVTIPATYSLPSNAVASSLNLEDPENHNDGETGEGDPTEEPGNSGEGEGDPTEEPGNSGENVDDPTVAPVAFSFNYAYDCQRDPEFPKKDDSVTLDGFTTPLSGGLSKESSGEWKLTSQGKYDEENHDENKGASIEEIVTSVAAQYKAEASEIEVFALTEGEDHICLGVIASVFDDGSVFFIGTTWRGGAGYYLLNSDLSDTSSLTKKAMADTSDLQVKNITVSEDVSEFGDIAVSETAAVNGVKIIVNVTPNENYALKSLKYTYNNGTADVDVPITLDSDDKYSFIMPAYDVEISGEFSASYAVILPDDLTNTSVSADIVGGKAAVGSVVTLKTTATRGYGLSLTAKAGEEDIPLTGENGTYTFTMPAANVEITAEEEELTPFTLEENEYSFDGSVEFFLGEEEVTEAYTGETIKVVLTADKGYQYDFAVDEGLYSLITDDVTPGQILDKKELEITIPEIDGEKDTTISVRLGCQPKVLHVVAIAEEGFKGCSKITSVVIPESVTTIGANAFAGCSALEGFEVAEANGSFADVNGVLFNKLKTTLIAFPAKYGFVEDPTEVVTYAIPEGVETIADGAFDVINAVSYVFCADEDVEVDKTKQPAFVADSNIFHLGMTTHTAEDGRITTPPGCLTTGSRETNCEVCGLYMGDVSVDALGHAWPKDASGEEIWQVELAPTCVANGSYKRTCERANCGATEDKVVAATQKHVIGEGIFEEGNEVTCEKDGTYTYICTQCNEYEFTDEEIEAANKPLTAEKLKHKITGDNITAIKDATCKDAGYIKGYCDHGESCDYYGEIITIDIAAKDPKHENLSKEVIDLEPTCTEKGLKHFECEYCGYKGAKQEISALKHSDPSKVKWEVEAEATCEKAGLMVKYCENCGEILKDEDGKEYKRTIAATGHNYDEENEVVVAEATCMANGEKKNACTVCGKEKTEEIPKLTTHAYKFIDENKDGIADDSSWTEDEAATCKKVGKESRHCTVEGCTEKTDVRDITMLAHVADDTWEVVEGQEATCYRTGLKKGKCTVCEQEDVTIVIPMLAHDFGELEDIRANTTVKTTITNADGEEEEITCTAADCEHDGYKVKYCKNTGCTEYTEVTAQEKYGHKKATKAELDEVNAIRQEAGLAPITITTDAPPTCEGEGTDYEFCKECRTVYGTPVDATGHAWAEEAVNLVEDIEIADEYGDKTIYKAATCTKAGWAVKYCEECDEADITTLVKIPELGHEELNETWTADETPATCIKKQFETNECKVCHEPLKRDIGDFAAHDWAETKTEEAKTCVKDGVSYYACETDGCNARKDEVVDKATGHVWATAEEIAKLNEGKTEADEGYIKVPANVDAKCLDKGYEYGYCEECKDVIPTEIDPIGHLFADRYTEIEAPTCKKTGSKARVCTRTGCKVTTTPVVVKELGHEWEEDYTIDQKSTCSNPGSKSIHCVRYEECETSKEGSEVTLSKADHTYDENNWTTIKIATCFETGLQENFCSVCNKAGLKEDEEGNKVDGYTTKVLEKKEHTWSDDISTDPASCTEKGSRYKTCTRVYKINDEYVPCTGTYEVAEIPATGHILDSATKQTKAATCVEGGYDYGTCTNDGCTEAAGQAKANFTSALGHDWQGTVEYEAPTCTEDGSKTGKCSRCGENTVETIPATNHNFEGAEWEVVDGVDCTTSGSKIQKCTVEGCDAENPGIVAEEHAETEWKITKKATCTAAGEMVERCVACKTVISEEPEEIPAKGHSIVETVITSATCSADGVKSEKCTVCDYEDNEIAISASEDYHDFTEWQVLAKPTCTEKGQNFRYCEICLKSEIKKTLATGHVYGNYIVDEPAECEKTGSQHKECTVCGYKTITDEDTIPALKHEFVGNECKNGCGSKIFEYAQFGENADEIVITKYNGSEEELYIPAVIGDKTVVAIGDKAFMKIVTTPATDDEAPTATAEATDLKTVFIPDTVTSIGEFAFANTALKAVTLSENVTEIGKYAFGYTATAEYEEVVDTDTETEATPAPAPGGDEATEGETTPVYELKVTVGTAVENFTIYGTKGTEAQAYAKDCDCDGKEETVAKVDFVYLSKVYSLAENNDYIKFEDENTLYVDSFELNEDGTGLKDTQAAQLTAMIDAKANSTGNYRVEKNPTASYIDKDGNPVELFGTGSTLRVVDEDDIVVKEITIAIKGDVNGDGVYDAIDCMLVQLAITEASFTLEGAYYTAANCVQDTELNEEDLSGLVNKVLGVEDEPAEEETTVPSTEESTAPSTTEPTTAPASTEDTSDESTPAESTPAESTPAESTPAESTPVESTPAATESQPAASEPAATTTTTQAPATTTQAPAATTTTDNSAA